MTEEDFAEMAAMQRVSDLLEACSDEQLHKLFFEAVTRYKDDILLGRNEARNDLLVSACVQHPEFEEQVEAMQSKNMRLMGAAGVADDPVELSSDESDSAEEGAAAADTGASEEAEAEAEAGAEAVPPDDL